jgi:hypothetical protein
LPFAALPNPNNQTPKTQSTPLLVEHEIVNLPSVSTLAVLRKEVNSRQRAPKAIAILADPVFTSDDSRLKSPQQKLDKPNVNELDLSRSAYYWAVFTLQGEWK